MTNDDLMSARAITEEFGIPAETIRFWRKQQDRLTPDYVDDYGVEWFKTRDVLTLFIQRRNQNLKAAT